MNSVFRSGSYLTVALAVCLIASGCSARSTAVMASPAAAPKPHSAPASRTIEASEAAAADSDALWNDLKRKNIDYDAFLLQDPARLAGPSKTVSGTIVWAGENAALAMPLYWVDAGTGSPSLVVMNPHTRLTWPPSWGTYRPAPETDEPSVKLPSGMPDPVGLSVVATTRTARLAGTARDIAFALDFEFVAR